MDATHFRISREEIEKLCSSAENFIKLESFRKSQEIILTAQTLLKKLSKSVDDTIQKRSLFNLGTEINYLIKLRGEMITKKKTSNKKTLVVNKIVKKTKISSKLEESIYSDGNLAIKCNWNDRGYEAPCSARARKFNLDNNKKSCSSKLCDCREYNKDVNINDFPCYESIALKEMYFGAGYDLNKRPIKPRHILGVKKYRTAILTTIPPGYEEKDRLIVGCLFIKRIKNTATKETRLYGDKIKSIKIPFRKIKINFWDHYKNPIAKDKRIWGSWTF